MLGGQPGRQAGRDAGTQAPVGRLRLQNGLFVFNLEGQVLAN